VLVEKLVREARLLIEEDHGSKVGLFVGALSDFELAKVEVVDMMVWAFGHCTIRKR
jgi:hypothetical protein